MKPTDPRLHDRDLFEDLDWIGVELDIPLDDLVENFTTVRTMGRKEETVCNSRSRFRKDTERKFFK